MPGGGRDYHFDGLTLEEVCVRASEGLELPGCVQNVTQKNVSVTRL